MRRFQSGITLLGGLVLLFVVGGWVYVGIRLVPVYLNYMKIAGTLDKVKDEFGANPTNSDLAIRKGIERHFDIESVDNISPSDIVIKREGGSFHVTAEYEGGRRTDRGQRVGARRVQPHRRDPRRARASGGRARCGLPGLVARTCERLHDVALLEAALTHRSAAALNNERLEFLGDAVLSFVVAEILYRVRPGAPEGDLSRLRASLVSGDTLAAVAAEHRPGDWLVLGEGELKSGGYRRKSILADGLEAVVGAIYLDGGMDSARSVVERLLHTRLDSLPPAALLKDAKTRLQGGAGRRAGCPRLHQCSASRGRRASRRSAFAASCRARPSRPRPRGRRPPACRAGGRAPRARAAPAAGARGMNATPHRFGSVALLGRPERRQVHAAQCTDQGQKIGVVSPKPQTTRHRILGILTRPQAQLVFLDTRACTAGTAASSIAR